MKQPSIQEHFPSKKNCECGQCVKDCADRKRTHPDSAALALPSCKRPVFTLAPTRGAVDQPPSPSHAPFPASSFRPFSYSAATLKILEGVNSQRPARPAPSVDDILASVPAREKYKGLLAEKRELMLPWEYERLAKRFETCDSVLSFMKLRHEESSFPALQRAVESSSSVQFASTHLQQILHVLPAAYRLHWVSSKLVVHFPDGKPSSTELLRRSTNFRRNLLEITKKHHETFLQTLPSRPQVNAERIQCWFHKFDLHGVPQIPLAELPPKPVDENRLIINDFLRIQTARNDASPVLEEIPDNAPRALPHTKFLSPAVRAKVFSHSTCAETSSEQICLDARRRNLLTLCETLKAMFLVQTSPSMFVDTVLRKLRAMQKVELTETGIRELLEEAVKIFPTWLHLIPTSMGEVLRADRRTDLLLSTIYSEVAARYPSTS